MAKQAVKQYNKVEPNQMRQSVKSNKTQMEKIDTILAAVEGMQRERPLLLHRLDAVELCSEKLKKTIYGNGSEGMDEQLRKLLSIANTLRIILLGIAVPLLLSFVQALQNLVNAH